MMGNSGRKFTPPVDVIEVGDRLIIIVEIAGMQTDEFEVTLMNRSLIISGQRQRPAFDQPAFHQVGITYGQFQVKVNLPRAVGRDDVHATYTDGFLQIDLPCKPEKTVHIGTSDNNQGQQHD